MNIFQNVPSSLTSWTQKSWWQWTTHNTIMFLCCWDPNIWCWWIQHYKQDQSTCSRLSAGDFLTFPSPVQLSLAKNNTGMVSIEKRWKITHCFFLKKKKIKLAKWNLTVQTFSLVRPPAASRFPPNISVHKDQQNTSGDLFHPQNVFSVSMWYLSPACPVKMSQQRKLKRKTVSRFHWGRKRGLSVPSCSLSASFNICTNMEKKQRI